MFSSDNESQKWQKKQPTLYEKTILTPNQLHAGKYEIKVDNNLSYYNSFCPKPSYACKDSKKERYRPPSLKTKTYLKSQNHLMFIKCVCAMNEKIILNFPSNLLVSMMGRKLVLMAPFVEISAGTGHRIPFHIPGWCCEGLLQLLKYSSTSTGVNVTHNRI